MYVLMDIEWITNDNNDLNLTQVAAMRVDEKWNEIDTYFARIRPRDPSFHQWKHMGYSGGEKNDFLTADKLPEALRDLDNWIGEDILGLAFRIAWGLAKIVAFVLFFVCSRHVLYAFCLPVVLCCCVLLY